MALRNILASVAGASVAMATATPAQAGTDPFIGEIVAYGMDFCPQNWLPADGRLLSIAENDVLFVLYGTTYGGNGIDTFALPDLRGRAALGAGTGAGLGTYVQGQTLGSESFTVTTVTMPAHSHTATLFAVPSNGNSNVPTGRSLARDDEAANQMYSTQPPANNMNAGDVVIGATGSGQPVSLTAPSLAMTYCVAQFGIFPSRP